MAKHLILIHGRSTKPRRAVKQRLVLEALRAGLERVSAPAAARLRDGRVKVTLAYYGDILNALMIKAEPWRREQMVEFADGFYEPDHSYDADLATLLARPTANHTLAEYKRLRASVPDEAMLDDVFRILSPVVLAFGLTDNFIRSKLPDLGAYLMSRETGSTIRQRLQAPLERALRDGHDVALVSHSMGCIVAYDVLWKLSRMSEHRRLHDRKVSLWMTLGSPLGDQFTKRHLYDANEPDDGRYPANITHWLNIAARDDFVAYDGDTADDYKDMKKRRLIGRLEDLDRICTFWSGREGSNPHKFYGYLNHPTVARRLGAWINS